MDPEIKMLIETMLKSHTQLTGALIAHIQSTSETDKSLRELADVTKSFITSADVFVKSSQERIKYVEKQLDKLIDSITRD